jgi:hypothetical protein
LDSISDQDPIELTEVKQRARQLIIQWIADEDDAELPPTELKPDEGVQQPYQFLRPAIEPIM